MQQLTPPGNPLPAHTPPGANREQPAKLPAGFWNGTDVSAVRSSLLSLDNLHVLTKLNGRITLLPDTITSSQLTPGTLYWLLAGVKIVEPEPVYSSPLVKEAHDAFHYVVDNFHIANLIEVDHTGTASPKEKRKKHDQRIQFNRCLKHLKAVKEKIDPTIGITRKDVFRVCEIVKQYGVVVCDWSAYLAYAQLAKKPSLFPFIIEARSADFAHRLVGVSTHYPGQEHGMHTDLDSDLATLIGALADDTILIDPWLGLWGKADQYCQSVTATIRKMRTTARVITPENKCQILEDFTNKQCTINIILLR